MDKLSRQDVFDLVYNYYDGGGETGFDSYTCVYYADNGGHCAVGVLLDHLEISRKDLIDDDGDGTDRNSDCAAKELVGFLGEKLTNHLEDDVFSIDDDASDTETDSRLFLGRMQQAHDRPAAREGSPAEVAESLATFAEREKLTVPD